MKMILFLSFMIVVSLLKADINEVISWSKKVQHEGAAITPKFYEYPANSGVEKIGFFTKKFKWSDKWGNSNDKYVFIDGKVYKKKEFYKKLYKMFRAQFSSTGCPRIYWPKFYPKPEWKEQYAYRDKSMTRLEYNRCKWEKLHFRARNKYQTGKLQAEIIKEFNRQAKSGDYEESNFLDIFFLNYLLEGYPPDIFQRHVTIDGAKKWLAIKKKDVNDTYLAQDIVKIFEKFGDNLIPSKKEREKQFHKNNEEFQRSFQQWKKSLSESRDAKTIKSEEDETDSYDRFIQGCKRAKKLLEKKQNLAGKDKKALQEINKILTLNTDANNGNLNTYPPPSSADIAAYCLLKNILIGEGHDEKRLIIKQYIKDREKKFPNIETKITQVDLRLVNENIDLKEYSTHRFLVIIKDSATGAILNKTMFHIGSGNIIFFTFAIASITVKIEPSQKFPFKGEGAWNLLNAKSPLILNLKKMKTMK